MNTPSVEPTPRRLSTWIWVFLGLTVLAASFAGTSMLWPTGAKADNNPNPNGPTEMAVCFGHVDAPNGVIPIAPSTGGRVVEVFVNEGDYVRERSRVFRTPGVLFRLDSAHAELGVMAAEQDWLAATESLKQAEKLPEQHKSQLRQQQFAIEAAESEVKRAEALLAKTERFHGIGQASDEDLKAAKELKNKAIKAKEAEEAKRDELTLQLPDVGVRRAQINVQAKKVQLDLAQKALDECTVKAPCDGTVLRRMVNVGDLIGTPPSQPSLIFCPDLPRIVRAEVEQEFASRVFVGQMAQIQDDTRASSTWRGKVKQISDWYSPKRSVLLEPKQFNDVRTLECIVELEPGQPPLKIGQRVRVTLIK